METFSSFVVFLLGFLLTYILFGQVKVNENKKFSPKDFRKILITQDIKELLQRVFLGVVSGLVFSTTYLKLISSQEFVSVLYVVIAFLILGGLLYISIFDYIFFQIPTIAIQIILAFALAINVFLFVITQNGSIELWERNFYVPAQNIIASVVAGLFILGIRIFTQNKGMGEGDIYVAAVAGLITGTKGIIVMFYITIFLASIYGIIISILKKKFRGVKIPFVPFIALGCVLSFLFANEIIARYYAMLSPI